MCLLWLFTNLIAHVDIIKEIFSEFSSTYFTMINKSVPLCFAVFGLVYYFLPDSIFNHFYYDIPKTNITVENAYKISNMIKLTNHYMQKSFKLKHHKHKPEEELSKTIFNETFVKFIDTFTKVNKKILEDQLVNYTQISSKKEEVDPNYMVKGWPKNTSTKAEDYINFSNPNTAILKPKFETDLEGKVDKPQILVVVQSAPKNYELRQEVRNSYGQNCKNKYSDWCHLTFIIGELQNSNDPLQNTLVKENIRYGDILQEPFIDSYNNLTLKTLYILKYFNYVFNKNLENKFLLKCDDDSYVHLESLWALAKSRMQKNSTDLIGFLELGSYKHHYMPYAHKPTKKKLAHERLSKWILPGNNKILNCE